MNRLGIKFVIILLLALLATKTDTLAQSLFSGDQEIPVTTAVPFLRIIPDARSGAMGDVGLATSPDNYSLFHNPAKLAFIGRETAKKREDGNKLGVGISYIPWLRTLVNDIYMANLSAFYRIDENQALGASFRYFSLGDITFTNINGETTGEFRPNEFAFDIAYARVLAKGFSTALALRFIYSNLAAGQTVGGVNIKPGVAAAADIAFYYNVDIEVADRPTNLAFGLNFSNLGSKITYTESTNRDFIPMNMGLGTRYTFNIDDYNQISLAFDINKLLVPTPSGVDEDGNGIPDYREKSVPAGLFGSFSDAPGGFKEEMREITQSIGVEYWYDQLFAVRFGYFNEHENKGNRKFITAGVGIRYSVFGLDFSYLIPTTVQRNPLDNTLRFTLIFNFEKLGAQDEEVTSEEGL